MNYNDYARAVYVDITQGPGILVFISSKPQV